MCTVERAHVKFKQKGNKIDSNHYRDFPPAFIDDFLHDASFDYVEMFYSGKNYRGYNLGFEVNNQRMDMLQFLVVPSTLSPQSSSQDGDFMLTIYNLPEDYYHRVRERGTGGCSGYNIEIVQHEDLDVVLYNAWRKPSDRWKRAVGVYKNNQLWIYSESAFTSLTFDYLKKPTKPFLGGYDTLEFSNGDTTFPSSASTKIDLDFPDPYCDILIDIAVQNVFGQLRDYNHVNYLKDKLINKTF